MKELQIVRVVSHKGSPLYSVSIYYNQENKGVVEFMWELLTKLNELKEEEILLYEWADQFKRDLLFRCNIKIEVLFTKMTRLTKGFAKLFDEAEEIYKDNFKDIDK